MEDNRLREEDGRGNLGIALFCLTRSEVLLVLNVLGHGLLLLRISFLFRKRGGVIRSLLYSGYLLSLLLLLLWLFATALLPVKKDQSP